MTRIFLKCWHLLCYKSQSYEKPGLHGKSHLFLDCHNISKHALPFTRTIDKDFLLTLLWDTQHWSTPLDTWVHLQLVCLINSLQLYKGKCWAGDCVGSVVAARRVRDDDGKKDRLWKALLRCKPVSDCSITVTLNVDGGAVLYWSSSTLSTSPCSMVSLYVARRHDRLI